MENANDLPPRPTQYTSEKWAEYHRDPCGWCIKELNNPDPSVRCNAADILRGLTRDAEAAIPALRRGDPDALFDRVSAMVQAGYAAQMKATTAD